MNGLSKTWQKVIAWVSGYLSIVSFFLAGGFVFMKSGDEEVKATVKVSAIVTFIFAFFEVLCMMLQYALVGIKSYSVNSLMAMVMLLVLILKTVTFATLFALDMLGVKLLPIKSEIKVDKIAVDEDMPDQVIIDGDKI